MKCAFNHLNLFFCDLTFFYTFFRVKKRFISSLSAKECYAADSKIVTKYHYNIHLMTEASKLNSRMQRLETYTTSRLRMCKKKTNTLPLVFESNTAKETFIMVILVYVYCL